MIPYVIFIDLDGTIIGDVTSHLQEWMVERGMMNQATGNPFVKQLKWSLSNGLMRPGFTEFMHAAYSQHGIELFLATMSTRDWATVVIRNVEVVVGKKFNRPLFTRESFANNQKSLSRMRGSVFAVLKKKYTDLKTQDQLNGRMMLIDNTDILAERNYWVQCSTYDFRPHYDFLKNFDVQFLYKNFRKLKARMIEQGVIRRMNVQSGESPAEEFYLFLGQYYSKLSRQFSADAHNNGKELNDTFWRKCIKKLLPVLFADIMRPSNRKLEMIVHEFNNQGNLGNNVK